VENEFTYLFRKEYSDKIRAITSSAKSPMKYFTLAFGCQQNVSDGEKIDGVLEDLGFTKTDDRNNADVIIYNTCAIRDHAEQKVFGTIGSLVHLKRQKPNLVIGFCGCMMQQKSVVEELRKKYKHVNLVFGTNGIYRLPENLYKAMTTDECVYDVTENDISIAEDVPVRRDSSYKAWVSIMYGCNNFCSYCIVPYVRGRERSREPVAIISEVEGLVKNGYKDITLLGQNVNSYCKDNSEWNFAKLLREVNKIPGDFRIRFMSSHPKDATFELFDTIAECEKVSRHLHLPFQSGSNRILELMNRRYTREKYTELIKYAKEKIPDLVLTSDVIVGFPTETDEDFEDTLTLVNEIDFQGLYTFIYSIRPGTPAAKMMQVDDKIKHERFERLVQLQTDKATTYNSTFIGKTVKVLSEGYTDDTHNVMTGRTDGNVIVNFTPKEAKEGTFSEIQIDKALNWAIFGKEI